MKRIILKAINLFERGIIRLKMIFHGTKSETLTENEAIEIIREVYSEKEYFDVASDSCPLNISKEADCDLSLIVPVYNSAKYLRSCIDSLLNQVTEYNYEVICIDDGSKDESLEVLCSYGERIRTYTQKNVGISATRNRGLSLAVGEYVGFVDNDDMVEKDYVQKLMAVARNNDADYVKCGHKCYDKEMKNLLKEVTYPDAVRAGNDIEILKYDGYVWGGIQKRSLWSGFGFPHGYWYEDMITRSVLYRRSKVLVNISDTCYLKRIHDQNASVVLWNSRSYQSMDQFFLTKKLAEFGEKFGIMVDEVQYRILLKELGLLLYKRTHALDMKYRKALFILAADMIHSKRLIMEKEYPDFIQKMKKYERIMDTSFCKRDFQLWNLSAQYWDCI